jgi:hypothetical protein
MDFHGRGFLELVFLPINAAAVAILGTIQAILLALRQMPVVLGFVNAFTLRDVGIVSLIASGLFAAHGAVGDTLIDASLLIVQTLVHLVDARMVGYLLRHGTGGNQASAAEAREQERFGLGIHVTSLNVNSNKCARRLSLRGGLL